MVEFNSDQNRIRSFSEPPTGLNPATPKTELHLSAADVAPSSHPTSVSDQVSPSPQASRIRSVTTPEGSKLQRSNPWKGLRLSHQGPLPASSLQSRRETAEALDADFSDRQRLTASFAATMSSEPTEVEQALEEELGARLPHSADKKSSSWGKKALEGLRWDFHATDVGRAVANLKLAHKLEKAAKGDLDESRLPPHYQGRAPSDLKERAKYCRSEAFGEISRFAGKTARRILNTSNMVLSGAKLTLSIVGVGTIAGLSTVAAALTGVGAVVGLVVSTGMGIFHTSMVGIGLLRKHRLAEMKHQSNELHAKADEIESLLKGVEATGTDRLNSLAKCLNTANLREAEKAECTDLFNTKQYDQLTSTLLLNAAAPFATADQLKSWLTEAPNGNVEVQEECKALLRSEAQFMRAQATTLRDFARLHHTRTNRKIAHNLLAAAAWASAGTAAALAIISLSGMPATVTLPLSLGFSTLAIGLFASSAGVAIGSKVAMSLSQMEAQMGENDPDKPASEQSQAQTFLGVEYRAALLAQMEVERRQQRGEGQEAPVLDFVFSQFLGRKDAETFISQAADWYQARAEKQERTTEQSLKKLRNVDTWVTRKAKKVASATPGVSKATVENMQAGIDRQKAKDLRPKLQEWGAKLAEEYQKFHPPSASSD